MLKAEAAWVGKTLDHLEAGDISPLLNVGSATAMFREHHQPWIDREIFSPQRARGVTVHHLDVQDGEGVDLRGDLADDSFMDELGSDKYQTLLCCNLLEHVSAPNVICERLEQLVTPGGYLIVTVPHSFPYHPDPIDTMFRPNVAALERLFPHSRLIRGEIIDCGTGWDYVERNPSDMIARVKRRLSSIEAHGGIKGTASFLPWLFLRFRQTCVFLQRKSRTL